MYRDSPNDVIRKKPTKEDVKTKGMVFTPQRLVNQILDKIPQEQFKRRDATFLDNACGTGNFLIEVLRKKMENGITKEDALSTIYGVDIDQDNIDRCRNRLIGDNEELRHIVDKNIVCADGLKYDYKFI